MLDSDVRSRTRFRCRAALAADRGVFFPLAFFPLVFFPVPRSDRATVGVTGEDVPGVRGSGSSPALARSFARPSPPPVVAATRARCLKLAGVTWDATWWANELRRAIRSFFARFRRVRETTLRRRVPSLAPGRLQVPPQAVQLETITVVTSEDVGPRAADTRPGVGWASRFKRLRARRRAGRDNGRMRRAWGDVDPGIAPQWGQRVADSDGAKADPWVVTVSRNDDPKTRPREAPSGPHWRATRLAADSRKAVRMLDPASGVHRKKMWG